MLQDTDAGLAKLLVLEDIAHVVATAARGSGFMRAGEHAFRLARAYPDCGMTGAELVNEIVGAASAAGVAVEISKADGPGRLRPRWRPGKPHPEPGRRAVGPD